MTKASLRVSLLASCVVGCAMLQGCAQYRLVRPDDDPLGERRRETMHALFWGSMYSPQVLSAECDGMGINDVVVHDNFGYALLSVITLGIWMPIDIEYTCAAPPPVVNEFPGIDEDEPDG